LTFADSSSGWTSTLSIWNWTGTPATAGGTDQLLFTATGNIAGNVNQISFYSGAGTGFLGTGLLLGNEVVPVPEPATLIAIGALAGLLSFRERRRLQRWFGKLARLVQWIEVRPVIVRSITLGFFAAVLATAIIIG
jgi:hypothetical protein